MFETTLRYKNLNDRNIIEGLPEYYDSVLIQAHLLAYSKKAVPQLVRDMAEERSFDYYIDPMIADFRIGTNFRNADGNIRGWHKKYVNELGDPLQSILNDHSNANARELQVEDVKGVAESVVRYQEDFVYERLKQEIGKYEELDLNRQDVQPKAVTPWVHKIEKVEDVQVCREILSYSKSESTIPLKPCIYTTTQFVSDTTNRSNLIDLLGEFDISSTFVVLEELNKYDTTENEYKQVIDFVYDLYKSGVEPHFYYGDFFSNLLAYFGLGGTAFATLYDEEFKEKLEHSGGGGLPSRHYTNGIKDFLKVDAAVDLMVRTDTEMCDCDFCSPRFETWNDLTEREQDTNKTLKPILKKHRVALRWQHARLVEENSLDEIIAKLRNDFDKFIEPYKQSPQISPNKNLQYLPRWIHAIEDRKKLAAERVKNISSH